MAAALRARSLHYPLAASSQHQIRAFSTIYSRLSAAISTDRSVPDDIREIDSRPLQKLATWPLVRSFALQKGSSWEPGFKIGTTVLRDYAGNDKGATSYLLDPFINTIFYPQYCGGRNATEIKESSDKLRALGFAGVCLNYAREVELGEGSSISRAEQIKQWHEGTIKTIEYTQKGDYAAIKYSGAGPCTLPLLAEKAKCNDVPDLRDALFNICDVAKQRDVKLWIDAEQQNVQGGIDKWTLELMRQYNKDGQALIYNTYQMYLKSSPQTLVEHMQDAKKHGYTLGAKVVRGAYLHTDPRHLIHDTSEDTDAAYDGAVKYLVTGTAPDSFARLLRSDSPKSHSQKIELVIATHNKHSVNKARALFNKNESNYVEHLKCAQLMGMADELSLSLTQDPAHVKVYKYLVWGTTAECIKYLLRRAEENKDSCKRTTESATAIWEELKAKALDRFRIS